MTIKFFLTELRQLTGIAAILRFPMPDIEDLSDSDSDEDNETNIVEGHICNNQDAEEEPKQKAPKVIQATEVQPVEIAKSTAAANVSIPTSDTKKIPAKAPKGATKKQAGRFAGKKAYEDDYGNDYDDTYDDYDF